MYIPTVRCSQTFLISSFLHHGYYYLCALGFNFLSPSSCVLQYLIELTLQDGERYLKYLPSRIAAAALCNALAATKKPCWVRTVFIFIKICVLHHQSPSWFCTSWFYWLSVDFLTHLMFVLVVMYVDAGPGALREVDSWRHSRMRARRVSHVHARRQFPATSCPWKVFTQPVPQRLSDAATTHTAAAVTYWHQRCTQPYCWNLPWWFARATSLIRWKRPLSQPESRALYVLIQVNVIPTTCKSCIINHVCTCLWV